MVTSDSVGSVERSQPAYVFDFCGGHVALDFVNTVGSRDGDADEHLATYGDLVAWAEARGVVAKAEAGRLRRAAAAAPEDARAAYKRRTSPREALYLVFQRPAPGKPPAADDLATLNRFVADLYRDAQLVVDGDRVVLETGSAPATLAPPF